ncbi:hypothetical protein [Bartonella pachyuromydis]|uniref:Uncharacterized protein n=1 Tax=Bartonella pachyuromydis TaxID=931097 RepID=A0ABP8VDF2_9HYPH
MEAFQKAMSPHFDDPSALRTLLGKITMSLFSLDPNLGVQNFASLEELKAALPAHVEFVAA